MNEHIKELADQAGVSIVGANKNGVFTLLSDKQKKFAELIVKECVALQHNNVIVGGASEYNRGRREMAEDILKHFGAK